MGIDCKDRSQDREKSSRDEKKREETIDCPFCSYTFPAMLGRYGCPNCEGEELE